jgi:hypothetical protein
MESLLETFYHELGSIWISSAVKEIIQASGTPSQTPHSQRLQSLIRKRAPLLLHDMQQQRQAARSHTLEFLEGLDVFEIPRIEIRRSFMEKDHFQKTTSTLSSISSGWMQTRQCLLVTSEIDFFDIANCLAKYLFKRPKLNDALLISTLLSTSLPNLRRKGFPVDRILSKPVTNYAMMKPTDSNSSSTKEIVMPPLNNSAAPPVSNSNGPSIKFASEPSLIVPPVLEDQVLEVLPRADRNIVRQLLKDELLKNNDNSSAVKNVLDKCLNDNGTKDNDETIFRPDKEKGESKTELEIAKKGFLDHLNFGGLLNKISNLSLSKQESRHIAIPGSFPGDLDNPVRHVKDGPVIGLPEKRDLTTELLQQSLRNLKSNRGVDFDCKIREDTPRAEHPTHLRTDTCHTPSNSLIYVTICNSMEFYMDSTVDRDEFFKDTLKVSGLSFFTNILGNIANIFSISSSKLHVYYDEVGSTVAFHKANTIFFNLRYFLGFHFLEGLRAGMTTQQKKDALCYWYIVSCHELAHSFVPDHNTAHEFYMQEYAVEFLQRFTVELIRLES